MASHHRDFPLAKVLELWAAGYKGREIVNMLWVGGQPYRIETIHAAIARERRAGNPLAVQRKLHGRWLRGRNY